MGRRGYGNPGWKARDCPLLRTRTDEPATGKGCGTPDHRGSALSETGGLGSRFGGMMTREPISDLLARMATRWVLGLLVTAAGMALPPSSVAQQTEEELQTHAERVLIRGLTWLQNDYPDRAARMFEEGLKVHPSNAAILAAMASAQEALGELGTARFYLDQALALEPEREDLLSQDLDLALRSGDVDAARSAVDRMIGLESADAALLLRHLVDLLDQGPNELSVLLAQRGLDLHPDDTALLDAAITAWERSGNLEQATRSAIRLADLSRDWDDDIRVTRLLMQQGRWEQAADRLIPLGRLDPEDAEVREMLSDLDARLPGRDLGREAGTVLQEREVMATENAPTDSLTVLRSQWQADAENEDNAWRLADFLIRSGQAREAAILADEHVDAFPRHLRLWALAIRAWIAVNEAQTALERAEDATLLFPGYPPLELALAEALLANDRPADALSRLDRLMDQLDPDSQEFEQARRLKSSIQQPQ